MKRSSHLDPDELAELAVSGRDEPAHLGGCDRCLGELAELRELVARLEALPRPPKRLLDAAKSYYRKRRSLDALIERLADDASLRDAMHNDPASVLRGAGIEPTPELIDAIRDPGRAPGDLTRRLAAKGLWL